MKNKNKVTKFPVARIKRIMQKDEEVGKVAQATPIVISKALELFLSMIIEEAHSVTAERGSKRVEAYHLKHAVESVDMLDFLKEIVESVPDPSAGGTVDLGSENQHATKKKRGKAKAKIVDVDTDAEASGEAPKKRRRRKPKVQEQEKEQEQEMEVVKSEPEPEPEEEDQEVEEQKGRSRYAKDRDSGGADDGWVDEGKPYIQR